MSAESGIRGSAALLVCAAALSSACALQPRPSSLAERVKDEAVSVQLVRARVRALAPRFAGELEALADQLAAGSTDPEAQLAATGFKINALPQMQMALFRPDPVAALIDSWALLLQLEAAVDRPDLVASYSPAVRDQLRSRFESMEAELQQQWREMTGKEDVAAARATIQKWAQENPLDRSLSVRKSTTDLLAKVTTQAGVRPIGAAAQLIETTNDLNARLDVLSAFGPKQVRWQAEYLVRELLIDPSLLKSTRTDLSSLLASAQQITTSVGDLTTQLPRERELIFQTLHDERLETQAFISSERQVLTDVLRSERAALTADLNRMGLTWIDQSFDRATALVDRLFLFILILVGMLVLGALLLALIVFRAWERHREAPRRERRLPVEA